MPTGREGPLVHIAGIIAFQLLRLPAFQTVAGSEVRTHEVLGAACAVGVTAGTPDVWPARRGRRRRTSRCPPLATGRPLTTWGARCLQRSARRLAGCCSLLR